RSCFSSLSNICTILWSARESSRLNTYVPAGRTFPPGISTGVLNVTVVFLSHSLAAALGIELAARIATHVAIAMLQNCLCIKLVVNISTPHFLSRCDRLPHRDYIRQF